MGCFDLQLSAEPSANETHAAVQKLQQDNTELESKLEHVSIQESPENVPRYLVAKGYGEEGVVRGKG